MLLAEHLPGNTPTDVGKTDGMRRHPPSIQKHPHGRGEDLLTFTQIGGDTETPPRTWGRRAYLRQAGFLLGNTPTDVGKTNR